MCARGGDCSAALPTTGRPTTGHGDGPGGNCGHLDTWKVVEQVGFRGVRQARFLRRTRVSLTERVPVDSESKTMKHSLISGSEAMVDLICGKRGGEWGRQENDGGGKLLFKLYNRAVEAVVSRP